MLLMGCSAVEVVVMRIVFAIIATQHPNANQIQTKAI
jgi:hypothetical protein